MTTRYTIFDRPNDNILLDASAAQFVSVLRRQLPGVGITLDGHTAVFARWDSFIENAVEVMYDGSDAWVITEDEE